MKRKIFNFISAATLIMSLGCAAFVGSSCSPENKIKTGEEEELPMEAEPEDPGKVVDITKLWAQIGKSGLEIPIEGEWNIRAKGFKKGDKITIALKDDPTVEFELECLEANDTDGAFFEIPEEFIGGVCNVVFKYGASEKKFLNAQAIFVQAIDNASVEQKQGFNVYGRVVDYNGNVIKDAVVSDGVTVTKTDSRGCYWIKSDKVNPFVFVSVPKNYEVAVNKTVPQFFHRFRNKKNIIEKHNFVLAPVTNTKARFIVYTDTHLANRTDDVQQFKKYFLPEVEDEIAAAERSKIKVYGIALGDLAWDQFWYDNNYDLKSYAEEIEGLQMGIFSTPGNHDNDPNISDDFLAAAGFRDNLGPTYYSVNIGDVHLIMMDDTKFYNRGTVQDYETGWTDDQIQWVKADLEALPAGSLIFFGIHIPWTHRPNDRGVFNFCMPAKERDAIKSLLDRHTVHFLSGHTHVNYTNFINKKQTEHNIAGVCGTWWWVGKYSTNKCRINGDGSPSGYKVFDINNKEVKWHFQALDRNRTYQFRAYDLKNCQITSSSPFSMNSERAKNIAKWANGYDKAANTSGTNDILINVFDYNTNWKIKVTADGTTRNVTRVEGADLLHVAHFNMYRVSKGQDPGTFATGGTSHLFKANVGTSKEVTITATDGQGNSYTETFARPRTLKSMVSSSSW